MVICFPMSCCPTHPSLSYLYHPIGSETCHRGHRQRPNCTREASQPTANMPMEPKKTFQEVSHSSLFWCTILTDTIRKNKREPRLNARSKRALSRSTRNMLKLRSTSKLEGRGCSRKYSTGSLNGIPSARHRQDAGVSHDQIEVKQNFRRSFSRG